MAGAAGSENPAKALCRRSLFQLLCVAGDWSRALPAGYAPGWAIIRGGPAVPGLVRCEMFRHTVFQGEQRPGFLLPRPFGWVTAGGTRLS